MAHREIGMDLAETHRKRFGRNSHCRAVSKNGRPANGHGHGAEKEKISV